MYPVASFEFYKKASKSAPCSPPKSQVHPTWRAPPVLKPYILHSSLPQPSPTHPAPKPQICTVFLLPPPCAKASSLSPLLPHLSSKPCSLGCTVSSPTGSVWGEAPAAQGRLSPLGHGGIPPWVMEKSP